MVISVLVRNWWAFVIRGLLAVLFGSVAILLPGATMLSLVLLFAIYAVADGIFAIASGVRAAQRHERWGFLILEGVVDIAAAIAAVTWPGLTVVFFVLLVAAWALLTGGLMLAAAFRVDAEHGRWWMAVGATVSMLYGAALFIAPSLGAVVLTWWIGAYALVFGLAMLVLAFRLRAKARQLAAAL